MIDDSSSEEDLLGFRFKKEKAAKKKIPEKKQPPLISFNEVITLTFVLNSYLIAKRVIIMLITFSTLNEELYNGFTALCSLLFAISAIVYVRDKSNIINRSNDNDNEDWPPEELVFEYTLEYAEGDKSIPEDVRYARFHSDIDSMYPRTFKDNEYLKKVVLNEGLREIGMMTFEGCESLQKIAFPSTLRKVGPNAFRSSGLERVELNNGLEVIEGGAFVNCKSLMKNIEFPSTLKHVGKNAFYGCSSLKKIVLNEGLKKVDDFVFEGCVSLESIKFPSTIRSIGANAFDHSDPFHNRSDLKEVVFNDGLLRIGEGAFNGCRSLVSIRLPSSVAYLGERAFYECRKLRKVVLSEVKTIDDGAFGSCEDLKEVLFKEGLQEVGVESFSWCTSLGTINFPSTLEVVGEKAFKHCKNLKEVTFSNGCNLKRVGKNAFANCESLERISITFPRLQYIIKAGHNITNEISEIAGVQCITKQQHWICNLFGRKNPTEVLITGGRKALSKVGQINKLIKNYEIKEATVLIELALWKSKMEQAGDAVDTSNRGAYRIGIPGPVQEAILQYINPAKEKKVQDRPIKRRMGPNGSVVAIYDDE